MLPSAAGIVLNQGSLESHEANMESSSHMSFSFHNSHLPHLAFPSSLGLIQNQLTLSSAAAVEVEERGEGGGGREVTSSPPQLREALLPASAPLRAFQASTLHRSCANPWPWGEDEIIRRPGTAVDGHKNISNRSVYTHDYNSEAVNPKPNRVGSSLSVGAMRMKKVKARRKVREPRFCFKTMSEVDVLDDGYKWRKYGQKVVKNTQHPRSYYRCTQDNCRVKKRIERLAEDPRMVITTYEGRHAHSPSHDEDDQMQASSSLQLSTSFFW